MESAEKNESPQFGSTEWSLRLSKDPVQLFNEVAFFENVGVAILLCIIDKSPVISRSLKTPTPL